MSAPQNTPSPGWMEARRAARPWLGPRAVSTARTRPRPLWASPAAAVVGARFPLIAESLSAALGLKRGQRVLDLGAGSGHVALSAGRRGCQVAALAAPDSTPYMRALLERDQHVVAVERLSVDCWQQSIDAAPIQDADFDVVTSSFAAMFEPDQQAMANEMLRLCRPGGQVGVTSWTPASFIGRLFGVIATHVPNAGDAGAPFLWGTTQRVTELFGTHAAAIHAVPRTFIFRYGSVKQCLDIWRSTYEPLRQALATSDRGVGNALIQDLRALIERGNVATDGGVALRGDYLEVVVRKRPVLEQKYSH